MAVLIKADALGIKDKEFVVQGYLKELIVRCQAFTNRYESTKITYLVCFNASISADYIAKIYQKRWKVKEYHKSLKSNASVAKIVTIQISHLVMSMMVVFKLEFLKIKHHLTHFALRAKMLIRANFVVISELKKIMLWVMAVILIKSHEGNLARTPRAFVAFLVDLERR